MKKYITSLSHSVHGEPEPIKVAFLCGDGLVILDGRIHSTIVHCQIAAGCKLLVCDVVGGDDIDIQAVENVEVPE